MPNQRDTTKDSGFAVTRPGAGGATPGAPLLRASVDESYIGFGQRPIERSFLEVRPCRLAFPSKRVRRWMRERRWLHCASPQDRSRRPRLPRRTSTCASARRRRDTRWCLPFDPDGSGNPGTGAGTVTATCGRGDIGCTPTGASTGFRIAGWKTAAAGDWTADAGTGIDASARRAKRRGHPRRFALAPSPVPDPV